LHLPFALSSGRTMYRRRLEVFPLSVGVST
jgi:hypothetical protein